MNERDAKPANPAETPSEREQRLAEALRANLRRRKKPHKSKSSGSSTP